MFINNNNNNNKNTYYYNIIKFTISSLRSESKIESDYFLNFDLPILIR
jgi:hypothetical protein